MLTSSNFFPLLLHSLGKYGYFDGERIRVVEYGANKHGFQPSGDGITVEIY